MPSLEPAGRPPAGSATFGLAAIALLLLAAPAASKDPKASAYLGPPKELLESRREIRAAMEEASGLIGQVDTLAAGWSKASSPEAAAGERAALRERLRWALDRLGVENVHFAGLKDAFEAGYFAAGMERLVASGQIPANSVRMFADAGAFDRLSDRASALSAAGRAALKSEARAYAAFEQARRRRRLLTLGLALGGCAAAGLAAWRLLRRHP